MPIFWVRDDGQVIYVNDAACAALGYTRAEMLDLHVRDIAPDVTEETWSGIREALEQNGSIRLESIHRRKDGSQFPVAVVADFLEYDGRKCHVACAQDITERRRSQAVSEAISRAESLFVKSASGNELFDDLLASFLELTESGYGFIGEILKTNDGTPFLKTYAITNIAWNEGTRRLYDEQAPNMEFFGLENLFGTVITTGQPVIANNPANDPRSGGIPAGIRVSMRSWVCPCSRANGSSAWLAWPIGGGGYDEKMVEYLGAMLVSTGCLVAAYQVRERLHQQDAELAHMQRVGSMGEMASTLAHEVNQPLTVIANYAGACAEMLRSKHVPLEELAFALEQISDQAILAGSITHRLRQFVTKKPPQRLPVNLNELVEEVKNLLDHEFVPRRTRVRLNSGAALPCVAADRIQITQVIFNLIRNAIEAMEQTEFEKREASIRTSSHDGEVQVEVADVGCGIPPGDRDRVFEPYFTSKADGLGMGLSICRTILANHGGRLTCTPNTPGGTVLRFTLPVQS